MHGDRDLVRLVVDIGQIDGRIELALELVLQALCLGLRNVAGDDEDGVVDGNFVQDFVLVGTECEIVLQEGDIVTGVIVSLDGLLRLGNVGVALFDLFRETLDPDFRRMLGGVGNSDEPCRTQCLFKGLSIIFMADRYKTGLVLVRGNDFDFSLRFGVGLYDLGENTFPIEGLGNGPDERLCVGRSLEGRRDVEGLPGTNLVDRGLSPCDLDLAVLYFLIKRVELFALAQGLIDLLGLLQIFGRAHFLSRCEGVEQTAFAGRIPVQDFQSGVDGRFVAFELCDGLLGGKVRKVLSFLLHLIELDASLALNIFDDLLAVFLETEDLDALHIENCHAENTSFLSK